MVPSDWVSRRSPTGSGWASSPARHPLHGARHRGPVLAEPTALAHTPLREGAEGAVEPHGLHDRVVIGSRVDRTGEHQAADPGQGSGAGTGLHPGRVMLASCAG